MQWDSLRTGEQMKRVPPQRLTMEEIAARAGVSKVTVSRALSGNPLVNAETRKKVHKAAEAMGYRLNASARQLRLGRSETVAVVVEIKSSPERAINEPYPLTLLGGVMQELTVANYNTMLTTTANFIGRPINVDGVILLGQGIHDDAVAVVERSRLPLVVWGSFRHDFKHVIVGSDNLAGGELAARRFLELGRRSAVFLGNLNFSELADRREGFEKAFAAGGGRLLDTAAAEFTFEAGYAAIAKLFARHRTRIDAIFAGNDAIAMGAIRWLCEQGIRVPETVSVIGFDDAPGSAFVSPAVTTIRQDWHEGGRQLARKTLGLIRGKPQKSSLLAVSLVIRAS
jgi:DNA-binding LacI/PurR family transcriptional regulator